MVAVFWTPALPCCGVRIFTGGCVTVAGAGVGAGTGTGAGTGMGGGTIWGWDCSAGFVYSGLRLGAAGGTATVAAVAAVRGGVILERVEVTWRTWKDFP